jgi:peptide/nickel transport system substrate-binding protein
MTPRSTTSGLTRRKLLQVAAIGGAGAYLAACAPATTPTGAASPSAAAAATAAGPKRGGILSAADEDNVTSLDPHKTSGFQNLIEFDHFYTSLVRYSAKGAIEPDLATKWDMSADGLTYTFQLRPDVKFHNGRLMTSDDVKYSVERVLAKETAAPYRSYFDPVDKIETPDKSTVVFRLKFPYAPFVAGIALKRSSSVVPREVVEKEKDLSNAAVGTGPWKLKEWVQRDRIVMERNPDYYESGLPYLDTIQYKILPEEATRIAGLRAKQLDYAFLTHDGALQLKGDANVTMLQRPNGFVRVGIINTQRKPLDDARVRRALDMALDRKDLIDKGIGEADISGPVPAGHPSYALTADELPPYFKKPDIDGAKKLLAEAGVPNGFSLTLDYEEFKYISQLAQTMQAQWKKIGVNAEIKVYPPGALSKTASKEAGYQFGVRFTAFTYYPDADNYTYNWFHSKNSGLASLAPMWGTPELDAMMEKARTMPDGPDRRTAYVAIQKKLIEECPTFWFHNELYYEGLAAGVKGFEQNPPARRGLSMRTAWLDR